SDFEVRAGFREAAPVGFHALAIGAQIAGMAGKTLALEPEQTGQAARVDLVAQSGVVLEPAPVVVPRHPYNGCARKGTREQAGETGIAFEHAAGRLLQHIRVARSKHDLVTQT